MKFSTKHILSTDQDKTMHVAQQIGAQLKGNECIELVGDVGAGKTTFVKGLAKGAGSKDHVSSPTFTISKIYDVSRFQIAHFDFYRLQQAGLIEHEIEEYIHDDSVVLVVEWSNVVKDVLPEERIRVKLTTIQDNKRKIEICFPEKLSYIGVLR